LNYGASDGPYISLALDSGDKPHVAYPTNSKARIAYSRWIGTNWERRVVTPDYSDSNKAYTSIGLDASDSPSIAFYNASARDLMFAKWNGTDWTVQTVDYLGNTGLECSLAIDYLGRPHIAYSGDGLLKCASWNGSGWEISTISPVAGWAYCSLAYSRDRRLGVAFLNAEGVCYGERDGSTWRIERVDGFSVGIALAYDFANSPNLIYGHSEPGRFTLQFATGPGIDSDADGIRDEFETGTGVRVSPVNTGTLPDNSDTDGDGFGDGVELYRGYDPTRAASTPELVASVSRGIEYRFYAAKGVSYRLETSANLIDWEVSEPEIMGLGDEVIRVFPPAGQISGFFRARRN
jgi:hypothetical protein